ncbi:MAG: aldo/keto reductase [Polyangiaceae bacterium]
MRISARLLDVARSVRLLAIAGVPDGDVDGVLALRTAALRDEDAVVRARALAKLRRAAPPVMEACRDALGDAVVAALRDVSELVRDEAAQAAGALGLARAEGALAHAVRLDPAWHVRRSAVRALSRLARAAGNAADGATAAGDGETALLAVAEALEDPFWRVRYSAVQALAEVPCLPRGIEREMGSPEMGSLREADIAAGEMGSVRAGDLAAGEMGSLREADIAAGEMGSVRAGRGRRAAAISFLAAVRRGEIEAVEPGAEPEMVTADALDAALGDADPAVVAARLDAGRAELAERSILIAGLASPHAALRRAAVRALAARGRIPELSAALGWLDDPRVPYAGEAVRRLLRRAGSRELSAFVLADGGAGPGARAWAVEETARFEPGALASVDEVAEIAGRAATDPDARVRAAGLRLFAALGDEAAIVAALGDPDDGNRALAVTALAPRCDDPAVRAALAPIGEGPSDARAALEIARLWCDREADDDTRAWLDALLDRAAAAPWTDVRAEAAALRAARGTLGARERAAMRRDPDPWIREAVMDAESAGAALVEDPDPGVRRVAARIALTPVRRAGGARGAVGAAAAMRTHAGRDVYTREGGSEREPTAAMRTHAGRYVYTREGESDREPGQAAARDSMLSTAASSDDPVIRALAARAVRGDRAEALAVLLRLTRDRAPMVRASAADALDAVEDAPRRLLELARSAGVAGDVLLAAHARLAASPSVEGLAALRAAMTRESLSDGARDVLAATELAYPEEILASAGADKPAPPVGARAAASTAREALSGHPDLTRPVTDPTRSALADDEAPAGSLASPAGESGRESSARSTVQAPTEAAQAAEDAPDMCSRRALGNTGILVSPLGLSGAGEVGPAAIASARDAGVNLFFWEPRYRALTEHLSRARGRDEAVIVAGSYEADRASIERDVERTLRRLRIDAVSVMLLFWVRSRARLQEGAFEALARLKEQGKVRAIGFSTHDRELAEEAILARPWDVIMCRLSAAHPGAERSLLPAAAARGVGVLAFSALCYGRLLAASEGVSAADCYRYALSQPGVSACLSAPRRWRELSENLTVLEQPTLEPHAIERLRAHGARVHSANKAFARLLRRA